VLENLETWKKGFQHKNENYGDSWQIAGETLNLWFPDGFTLDTLRKQQMHGLIVRMLDKLLRGANLELTGELDKVGEASADTFCDLGIYAFMAGSIAQDED
jgi:hypothetical protein